MQKKIKNKDLPHSDHVDFLEDMEKMAIKAFDYVMVRAVTELSVRIKVRQKCNQRLHKSDDLKAGWTGKVPKLELNFSKVFEDTMAKYMNALKFILMGDAAGKGAKQAAELLNLRDKIVPGVIPAAYLNSLDTHRQYYKDIFGETAPEIQKKLITESLDQIKSRVDTFLDVSLLKLKANMIESVDGVVRQINESNVAAVQEQAHVFLGDGLSSRRSVEKAVDRVVVDKMTTPQISQALRQAVERYRDDFSTVVNADVGLASAVGSHQCAYELFGRSGGTVRAAWLIMRDEKVCSFCNTISKKPDGSFNIYDITEFESAGYNFSRKRKDWVMCVPPAHHRCRCQLIVIPEGFDVDKTGSIIPAKKG